MRLSSLPHIKSEIEISRSEWVGFLSLFQKEVLRFLKVIVQTVLSPLVSAGLYFIVFGVSLSGVIKDHGGVSYLAFLIPGLVAMSALNNALQNSASSIMISKFHGDLQDLRLIPLSSFSITLAYVLACITRGALVGGLVFGLGQILFFLQTGEFVGVHSVLGLVLFLTMGCAIFGHLGIFSGFVSRSFDQINAFSNFVILPLIYLGGVFFSLQIFHPFWRAVAQFNPLVYMINGIRWSVLGISDVNVEVCFGVLLLFLGISFGLAFWSVKRGSYQRF